MTCKQCQGPLTPRAIRKGYRTCYQCLPKGEQHAAKRIRNEKRPTQRLSRLRRDAKKRGLLVTLSLPEYKEVISKPCFYCRYKLGSRVLFAGGLDRVDNSKDYELGNVVSCCFICNVIRGDHLTRQETKVAVDAIIAYRENQFTDPGA